jgi:hypothetical protein
VIGTSGATVLFVVNLLFAGVLGVGAGRLTCSVLRRTWDLKMIVMDAVLAVVIAVIATYLVSTLDTARGIWESRVTLVLAIAAASVVLRHTARLLVRSSPE